MAGEWAGSHSCDARAKSGCFGPYFKILSEIDLRNNSLRCLVEGISRQYIAFRLWHGWCWLLLIKLIVKTQEEQDQERGHEQY